MQKWFTSGANGKRKLKRDGENVNVRHDKTRKQNLFSHHSAAKAVSAVLDRVVPHLHGYKLSAVVLNAQWRVCYTDRNRISISSFSILGMWIFQYHFPVSTLHSFVVLFLQYGPVYAKREKYPIICVKLGESGVERKLEFLCNDSNFIASN